MDRHNQNARVFKALSDLNRLVIVDLLSCGEMCACNILKKLGITQPTLSHHMKILCDCELVRSRKEGKWMYYSLDKETAEKVMIFFTAIVNMDDNRKGDAANNELCEC